MDFGFKNDAENMTAEQTGMMPEAEGTMEAVQSAEEAVMAMKSMQSEAASEAAALDFGDDWKKALENVEAEMKKSMEKANASASAIVEKERAKCREEAAQQLAQRESELQAQIDSLQKEVDEFKAAQKELEEKKAAGLVEKSPEELIAEHEAELEKMKLLYEQQLDEASEAFREKNQAMRKEMDQYKEQIDILMLHIDDPFVLQEYQMKQTQKAAEEAAPAPAAEEAAPATEE